RARRDRSPTARAGRRAGRRNGRRRGRRCPSPRGGGRGRSAGRGCRGRGARSRGCGGQPRGRRPRHGSRRPGRERWGSARGGGLDVVSAVEEGGGALPLAAVGEDDRLAGGVVDAGLEAEAAQVSRVEPGAGTAVGGMGGIGGDRTEAEGREKPLERRIEIGIEAGKDAVEVGHRLSPEGIRGARHLAEGRRPGPARGVAAGGVTVGSNGGWRGLPRGGTTMRRPVSHGVGVALLVAVAGCATTPREAGLPLPPEPVRVTAAEGQAIPVARSYSEILVRTYVEDGPGRRRELGGADCRLVVGDYEARFRSPGRVLVPVPERGG